MNEANSHAKQNTLLIAVLLALIVMLGGYFRFLGINWDDFSALHPDERYLTLNLLPIVGGRNEFTHDNEHFPAQSLVVRLSEQTILSSADMQLNPAWFVGASRDTFGADLAELWLGNERLRLYDNPQAAAQALLTGEVAALLLSDADAQVISALNVQILEAWDSPMVQQVRCQGLYPETNGVGGYFDAYCSSLNPHNAGSGQYAYGTLPLFMAYFANDFVRSLGDNAFFSYQGTAISWRFLSALFDVFSIIFIFLIARRLHNSWVGLIAAALYAAAPLAIEKAHFGTVNSITAFFVVLALWAAVHVQDKGRLWHYVIFGVALGAALAGRINTIPLAGVIVLAGLINAAPVLDSRIAWSERERLLWRNIFGVFLAGIVTIIAFRIFNPYAFVGPNFFGIIPNTRFLADAQNSSVNVSGAVDSPPNWQWLGRISYLYPLKDMLFWGMGIAMGVMAWVGFGWSAYRLARGREFATRNILLFAWVLVYFGWIGRLWVLTMRYFLPIYGALAILAAWAIYELFRQARKHEKDLALTQILLLAFATFFGAIPAYYLLTTGLTATAIASGAISLALLTTAIVPNFKARSVVLGGFVVAFTLVWGLMYTNIYQHQLTRVQAARWAWENLSGDFSMQVENAPYGTPLINIALYNRSRDGATEVGQLINYATRLEVASPVFSDFVAPATGMISYIHAPHLADPLDNTEPEILYISIAKAGDFVPLVEVTLNQDLSRVNHPLGDSYDIVFDEPLAVEEGQRYTLKIEAVSGIITTAGEVILTEGAWDDRLTTTMLCTLPEGMTYVDDPASGLVQYNDCNGRDSTTALFQTFDMVMSYPVDEALKYNNMMDGLDVGDYLAVTSNRFYDSEMRDPARFPLTTAYYRALFNGELGYELVATFDESYELGVFSVSDQHLPIYNSPAWLNELESDEAFNVYDHPSVFIFRKTGDYDPAMMRSLLGSQLRRVDQLGFGSIEAGAQIVDVIYWSSLDADNSPTAIQMPYDRREANSNGGTWSERFDSDSLLNTNQPIGVVVWWISLMGIGLLAYPLLFTAFPNLADKGYGFAKIVGLLLIGWIAWFGANFSVPLWSQGGILILLSLLAILSAYLSYRQRDIMREYLSQYWGRLAAIEVLTLLLFIAFVGVRLSNPDLWHHPMGGEKPMDFAFFNATLRTTVFPAYNPWNAGGFINYYYFGYVIVGVPTLLLKIVPAFAYNLIVPSLFAMTGIGAFSAAFNIVDAWTSRRVETYENEKVTIIRRMGNPWIAGITALLLCVVLGNLDTPRVLIEEGIARLGGYERPTGLENYLIQQYIHDNGAVPEGDALTGIQQRAAASYITDNIAYEVSIRADLFNGFMSGIGRALSGSTLPLGSNRWYWAPTRTIQETPDVGGYAINELPYFTFLYADLHAHMISMPMMLFVIGFLFHEVQYAQSDERNLFAKILAIFLGALAVGMLRATNTWDYPTFTLLGMLALGYAWWRRFEQINRESVLYNFIYIGGFLSIAAFVVAPYTAWFASTYESVMLWTGGKTPLWAYWNIHGLFLFLLVSLLTWETARYLRSARVRDIAGKGTWFVLGAGIIAILLLGALIAALIEYQVALIVVPLVIWIGLLFFRPQQSVPMQFILVLAGLALSLTLGVEVVVLSGDIGRQNTVFKFYIQVWLLFSVMAGAGFAWVVQQADTWRFRLQALWFTPLMLLVAAAAMFPFAATRARTVDRFVPELSLTLNGLDYMPHASYALPENGQVISFENDYHLIRWLQENVQGTPVIMEGRGAASEYHYNARISINTGLPTVLGWRWHQIQQHTIAPLGQIIQQRESNIQYFYRTEDIASALSILTTYNVRYIIVSDMEISLYPQGIEKFNRMVEMGLLSIAYQHNTGIIYELNQDAVNRFVADQWAFNQAIGLDESFLPAYVPSLSSIDLNVNTDADVSALLPVLSERNIDYLTLTNPPRVSQFLPEVYDRFATLETLGILERIDNSEARRTYHVNQAVLQAILSEESQ